MSTFPFYQQLDAMDCGPTCLRMIAKHYGKHFSLQTLRDKSYLARDGVSMLGIADAAESIGFKSLGAVMTWEKLSSEAPLPLVAHWKQNHFVVIYKIRKDKVYVADPQLGMITYSKEEFLKGWLSTTQNGENKGAVLLLQPTPEFYQQDEEKKKQKGLQFLLRYLVPHRKLGYQLIIGLLLGAIIQAILPFLFQGIVDFGISNADPGFIWLILLFQFVLLMSAMGINFIRRWILLHMSTRINIALISDFLTKMMRLPVGFFETKHTGDILQRIGDHRRVESFVTTSSLNILFSLFNLVVFSIILAIFSWKILVLFLAGSILYFLWVWIFMKKRRSLDHRQFSKLSENQSKLIQLVHGIQDIKINNAERPKRWEWENIQAGLFKINTRGLALDQYQEAGGRFVNELKNILITVVAALAVINGSMTLGMLLAVSYILGQLNVPLEQMIDFMHRAQDASISLERLNEIHDTKEENENRGGMPILVERSGIKIGELSFSYGGPHSKPVLRDISMALPNNSVTAIVGRSGSGKTTLVKLLLGFYPPVSGEIRIGDQSIVHIPVDFWRSHCGVVMQDGYIFADTIANNIALGKEVIDTSKLIHAAKMACIDDFIDQLPLGYNTVIGSQGLSLSGGEKQRILIARAIYDDPDFLFIDEGTSSLDATNEKRIMENLQKVFRNKTVVIVAHRLSTVRNADKIVVLEKGNLVEQGTHTELTRKKKHYYELIRNQLEMG
ncbi:MAG: peptidase domain-containing ABC transporter, partial [Bacteroidales bacterium]|nr:peptidase domain-containing ABC transporter [Bacteroidales bacterium]